MAEFILDTSGEVRGRRLFEMPDGNWRSHWTWEDLPDALTQGYIEAFLSDPETRRTCNTLDDGDSQFRHLAPETLVRLIADCAAMRVLRPDWNTREHGAQFWVERNSEKWIDWGHYRQFPPLTAYLDNEGKVQLTEAP